MKNRCVVLAVMMILVLFSISNVLTAAGRKGDKKVSKKGEEFKGITCRIWFWGEDKIPGITDFFQESADLYHKSYPDVIWEVKHVDIDRVYSGFNEMIKMEDAPELHLLLGGVPGLEQAWSGNLSPVSDYVSDEVLSRINPEARAEGYWSGKQWLVPIFLEPWLFGINRLIWEEAGLDPDKTPDTWTDFVDALQKIKDAGYIPWVFGGKNGFYGASFQSALQYQYYDSAADYRRAITGDETFTIEKHSGWWFLVQELRDRGLFNPDAAELSLAEGQDIFFEGNAGIFFDTHPRISAAAREMGEDVIDVMIVTVPGKGAFKGKLPIPAVCAGIPSIARYKEEAGKFLEYLLTKERQEALYEKTGVFPATDYLKRTAIKRKIDKKLYDWTINNAAMTQTRNHPAVLEEAVYLITQEFITANISAEQAAQMYEEAVQKWRSSDPGAIENFRIWAEEDLPF